MDSNSCLGSDFNFQGYETIGTPNIANTVFKALKMVDGAVALVNLVSIEPGLLELAIHTARENPGCSLGVGPLLEDAKPRMGDDLAVQVEPMAIEAPG